MTINILQHLLKNSVTSFPSGLSQAAFREKLLNERMVEQLLKTIVFGIFADGKLVHKPQAELNKNLNLTQNTGW